MVNKHVNYLITYFGEQNDEINDDELEALEEELEALDNFLHDEDIFDLAKISIRLGKPDILEILLDKFDFNKKDLVNLNKELENFSRKFSDEEEIICDFEKIIKDYSKKPYHKKR